MVEVEGVAFHIVAGGEIIERRNDPMHGTESAAGGHPFQPMLQKLVPALTLEVGFILVAEEPEQHVDGIIVPRRGRPHPNFAQRPECFTFVALFVVLGLQPILEFVVVSLMVIPTSFMPQKD